MDVLELIDKLDDLVHNAKAVPLTDQVRIDRDAIYELLDEMRSTIPEEVKQARWIVKERQEMLAGGQTSTDQTCQSAALGIVQVETRLARVAQMELERRATAQWTGDVQTRSCASAVRTGRIDRCGRPVER